MFLKNGLKIKGNRGSAYIGPGRFSKTNRAFEKDPVRLVIPVISLLTISEEEKKA
jgi:hypothetical protein